MVFLGIVFLFFARRSPKEGKIQLISYDPTDHDKGFTQINDSQWMLKVLPEEIDSAYAVDTKGIYKGHVVYVEGVERGQFRLYLRNDVKELGFTFVEPAVYLKWVDPGEMEKVWEEKRPAWGYGEEASE